MPEAPKKLPHFTEETANSRAQTEDIASATVENITVTPAAKNCEGAGRTMHYPQLSEVIKLPGVADLPAQVRWLFARALKAELEGETSQAEELLELAVEWEAALFAPEPVA